MSKTFTAEDISNSISEARKFWREQHASEPPEWQEGFCTGCHKKAQICQHWNDVGGKDSLCCEMCFVESLVVFGFEENEAEDEV